MSQSISCLWFFLTIQQLIFGTHAQWIENASNISLDIDQAYVILSLQNYPDTLVFKYNHVICENCDFDELSKRLENDSNLTVIVDTRYAYDIQLQANSNINKTVCEIKAYEFQEHATYLFVIMNTSNYSTSCSIRQIQTSSYYWLPLIIGMSVLFVFIVVIQLRHRMMKSQRFLRFLPNVVQRGLINSEDIATSLNSSIETDNRLNADLHHTSDTNNELPLFGSTRSDNRIRITKVLPKRLYSLDAFRGLSLMIMILVNYGGGGYWFLKHSVWNGLTVADLVFPWFTWIMGVSIVFSHCALRAKNTRKKVIFMKICRRTLILFVLGLILQGGYSKWANIRIFGVLQRLALCYFFTATLVLIFDDHEDEPFSLKWPIGHDVRQRHRQELVNTLLHFWPQWALILLMTVAWLLLTFVPKFGDCPRGYLGPGGKHEHGKYQNCTGGAAGFIDRLILRESHMENYPTCKDIYQTPMPFEPEGLLGLLTGTLLCYLGVQAGHSFAHSTRYRRVCVHWIVFGLICGAIGLFLSKGGHSDCFIPINKNLWSLSFVLVLASSAFFILTILYLLLDVWKLFTGEPFLWLGSNSIVIYVGHEICSKGFPVQFQVEQTTHAQLIAMHLYGVFFWTIVAGLLYRKKIFINV